jgi:hypothetical protein
MFEPIPNSSDALCTHYITFINIALVVSWLNKVVTYNSFNPNACDHPNSTPSFIPTLPILN